jgi:predicted Rossmann-fold nucleotide-binding protein
MNTLSKIIEKYEHPIIGVIGATQPSIGYSKQETIKLGYELRKFVEKKGNIFTGGVPGVGLDAYRGIIDYCLEHSVNDKTFLLYPNINILPSEEYFQLANKINNKLNIETAGENMLERRKYVAGVADILIAVNGGPGTMDEALTGLIFKKQVICLKNSGGAAEILSMLKENIQKKIGESLIFTFDSVEQIIQHINKKLS